MDIVSHQSIKGNIYEVRGKKVMLDRDLAKLYGVPTKALVQAVKRNRQRFPSDFMYVLTDKEVANLRSQIVTSSEYSDHQNIRGDSRDRIFLQRAMDHDRCNGEKVR